MKTKHKALNLPDHIHTYNWEFFSYLPNDIQLHSAVPTGLWAYWQETWEKQENDLSSGNVLDSVKKHLGVGNKPKFILFKYARNQ
jgi:hypothetical protein